MHVASQVETAALAARLAPLLRAGDVVLLIGDLGAGKTTFTKALALGLGVAEPVTSPTFMLLRTYPTDRGIDLLHIDAYRLEGPIGMDDLALEELLESGFAVIEWGDIVASAIGPDHLEIHITTPDGDDEARTFELCGHGSWSGRLERLQ